MVHQVESLPRHPYPGRAEYSYVRDRSRIDVNKFWEMRYWSSKFGVRPEELKKAVDAVGVSPYAVARYFGKSG